MCSCSNHYVFSQMMCKKPLISYDEWNILTFQNGGNNHFRPFPFKKSESSALCHVFLACWLVDHVAGTWHVCLAYSVLSLQVTAHLHHKGRATVRLQDTSKKIISFHSFSTLPITKAVTSLHFPAQPWVVIIVIAISVLPTERLI